MLSKILSVRAAVVGVLVAFATIGPIAAHPAGATFVGSNSGYLAFTINDSHAQEQGIAESPDVEDSPNVFTLQYDTGGENHDPAWSPTGDELAFSSTRTGSYQIFTSNSDG